MTNSVLTLPQCWVGKDGELNWGGESKAWLGVWAAQFLIHLLLHPPVDLLCKQHLNPANWSDSVSLWFGFLLVWCLWHLLVNSVSLKLSLWRNQRWHEMAHFSILWSLSFFGKSLFLGQWFSQCILPGSTERPWGVKAKPGEVVWWSSLPYFNHNSSIFLLPL